MLSSVVRSARSLGDANILRGVSGVHLPFWSNRHLCTKVAQPSEYLEKTFVARPLTMLSDDEEMMRETGMIIVD